MKECWNEGIKEEKFIGDVKKCRFVVLDKLVGILFED